MAQTRIGSLAEAGANIAVGFAINWTANMVFLPMFGFSTLTAAKAFGIGMVFTLISLVRSYVLRRWFNGLRFGNKEADLVADHRHLAALPVLIEAARSHPNSEQVLAEWDKARSA